MFKLLLVLLLTLPNAFANLDLNTGVQLRSYPSLGGEFYAQSGYNFVWWGQGNKKNPLYGLIRPAIDLQSSVVINSITPRFEFYPISFLGIVAGKQFINSNYTDFPFYNCDEVRCEGKFTKDFIEYKMALGFKGIIAMGILRQSNNSYSKGNGMPVGEFRYATVVNQEEETEYYTQYVLGYQTSKSLIGAIAEYVRFGKSDQYYKSYFAIYNPKYTRTNVIYGLGTFESSHIANGFIALFRFNYELLPSKKLF